MSIRWQREAELALKAVSAAGEIALEMRDRSITVTTKESPRDVVTEVDRQIESEINEVLRASGHRVIGEESYQPGQLPEDAETFWLVDPIDGTANYVSGMPLFACSAGLWAERSFGVGAVSIPMLKELFFTFGDHSSYLNGRQLTVLPSSLKTALIAGGFSGSASDADRPRHYEAFARVNDQTRGCLRLGSATTNLCFVAAGRLQGCFGIRNQLWDVAAGIAIARRAGCEVYFSREAGTSRISYVVAAPGVGEPLRALIAQVGLNDFECGEFLS